MLTDYIINKQFCSEKIVMLIGNSLKSTKKLLFSNCFHLYPVCPHLNLAANAQVFLRHFLSQGDDVMAL